MSYITKTGQDALNSAMEDNDFSNALVSFKSGTMLKVRIPEGGASCEYHAHSVYKCFYTTPCTKISGEKDLYDVATEILYNEAKRLEKAGDEKGSEAVRKKAGQIRGKERYMVGFFDLATGAPIVIDLTKNQAKTVGEKMKKYGDKKAKFAFELSKSGSSTDTKVDLDIIIDDLEGKEKENFEKNAGKEFPQEVFGSVLQLRDREGQVEDVTKFAEVVKKETGFDLASALDLSSTASTESEGAPNVDDF